MKKLIITLLTSLALGAGSAQAILYNANNDGISAPAGATFTPSGGSLVVKSQAGFDFLGVTGGPAGGEIDLGESIRIDFDSTQNFDSLSLGLLFDGPEYGDRQEIAAALTDGSVAAFTLTATGTTTATWSFAGATVTNLAPATLGAGGAWRIDNPFGSLGVNSLTLYPVSSNPNGNESDFGLHAFQTSAVPDAGSTVAFLGLGVLGLAWLNRRFMKAS